MESGFHSVQLVIPGPIKDKHSPIMHVEVHDNQAFRLVGGVSRGPFRYFLGQVFELLGRPTLDLTMAS